jgi:deoxyribonuclease-4
MAHNLMDKLLFGTGGVPHSARDSSTLAGIERIAQLSLGCMELEFVQGVKMGRETALEVAELAVKKNIALSAHAPYYINLNAKESEKLKASMERVFHTARVAALCGASSIVFHPAYYMGQQPTQVYERVKPHLQQISSQLRAEGNKVWVRLEVTGKASQFGTLEEVLDLSADIEGIAPCIDFAHWHARTGKYNSYDEFIYILKQVERKLGRQALDNMHIHVSGIAYGVHGEKNHLDLQNSDFNYVDFVKALKDYKVKGLVVCESKNLEADAQLLQQTYRAA